MSDWVTEKAKALDGYTDQLLEKLVKIGPERVTLEAQLTKLKDEVQEVEECVVGRYPSFDTLLELADVVIVCHTAARVMGYSTQALDLAVLRKAARNALRDWYPTASGTARHTPEEAGE